MINEYEEYYFGSKNPDIDDLGKMEFCDAFIKETMRFYTPGPGTFPRNAKRDHTVGDIKIR